MLPLFLPQRKLRLFYTIVFYFCSCKRCFFSSELKRIMIKGNREVKPYPADVRVDIWAKAGE